MTVSTSVSSVSVFRRLWLGSILPSLALVVVIGVLLATGGGKREAPMIVFFTSLFAVPAIVLFNCWVLFINWQTRSLLIASGLVIPAVYLFGCILFVHGSGHWQGMGMLVLAPFVVVPMRSLGILSVLWALAIIGLVLMARHMAARGHLSPDPKVPGGHINDS